MTTQNYLRYQNQAASEKITLAILNGASRLQAWHETDDADVYKKTINIQAITSIKINGVSLLSSEDLGSIDYAQYYYDNEFLYIKTKTNPNYKTQYVVLTQKYFFSDKALVLPYDLNTGYEVYFEPLLSKTSKFGTELDIENQGLSAIEGSGSLTLYNDKGFWANKLERISFDNQLCKLYSYSSELESVDAKPIYIGFVESRNYDDKKIDFKLKDLLYLLRNSMVLKNVKDLGLRNNPKLDTAKQRLVYGSVKGLRPINVDGIINNSYPIAGKISVFFNSAVVIGTNTKFKSQVAPNDKLLINGSQYVVGEVTSDNSLLFATNYNNTTEGNLSVEIVPNTPKRYINRKWLISGHKLSEPTFEVQAGSTTSRLVLDRTNDIFDGDTLVIGDDQEIVSVNKVINQTIVFLAQSTQFIYPIGTKVVRPCVQNVKMNDLTLVINEDYTVDSNSGIIDIKEKAEENRTPLIDSQEYITGVFGNNYFTGAATTFTQYLKIGDSVRPAGTDKWYTVQEVEDLKITLSEAYLGSSFTAIGAQPEKTAISGLSILKNVTSFTPNGTSNLHRKFFVTYDDSGSVAVWFDIGNVGSDEPEHFADRSIEITSINYGDNNDTILNKIAQKLNLDGKFSCSISLGNLYIYDNTIGVRPAAKDPTADGMSVVSIARDKQKVNFVADVGDSLDNKGFFLYNGSQRIYFWFANDNNSNGNPIPNVTNVMIGTTATDDSATTVRNKTKTILEANGFTVTNFDSTSFIAELMMVPAYNIGTLPVGYSLTTSHSGASAWYFNNKWFVLPYFDATQGFWFNVDGSGSLPSFTADAKSAITLTSGMSESSILQAIADTAQVLAIWGEIESTDTSILLTDALSEELNDAINAGNSGLDIIRVQKGISENPKAGLKLQYKNFIFDDNQDVLSCDVYGKPDSNGDLLRSAPLIIKDLIVEAGLGDFIDQDSFDLAKNLFEQEISAVYPRSFDDKNNNLNYRDAINDINGAVFGILFQSNDFKLKYDLIRPCAKSSMPYLDESDILSVSVDINSDKIFFRTNVSYSFKEYDPASRISNSFLLTSNDSDYVRYISNKSTNKSIVTTLVRFIDANRLARRWGLVLESSSNIVKIDTKLQTINYEIGSVFMLSYPGLPQRYGSTGTSRLLLVQGISKSSNGVSIEAVDLSNAMNKIAKYSNITTNWDTSDSDTKILSGFYTDQYGLINMDENSSETNLIW